jgi:uncharacterized membrane protein
MSPVRILILTLRLLSVALVIALAGLIALIVPSPDNGPYMTPFAVLLVGLVSALVLLGYAGGLRDAPDQPPAEPPSDVPRA